MATVSGHVCLTGPGIGGWLVLAGYYHLKACLHRTEDFRLSALEKACHGNSFAARRDAAIIAVFTTYLIAA